LADELDALDTHWKIFRKRRDVRFPNDVRLQASPLPVRRTAEPMARVSAPVDSQLIAETLLDEFMPTGVLVNERREVVRMFGGSNQYLRLHDGWFSNDILEIVDDELRMALSGALPRAIKEMRAVAFKGLRVRGATHEHMLNLRVRPLRHPRGSLSYVLIEFEELGVAHPDVAAMRETDLGQASKDQLLSLESELRYTKENLQAMIEEMETSNEELQATNEELVASNEELQSTNEELHSVNEELYSVNSEHQKKIAELTELTNDMDNLLTSTEVHPIFLDENLCIRKFTPKIAETFSLLPQDTGRRIDNCTYTLDHPSLLEDIRAVVRTQEPSTH
jgi:two-component system CheB/CheR fusion protein